MPTHRPRGRSRSACHLGASIAYGGILLSPGLLEAATADPPAPDGTIVVASRACDPVVMPRSESPGLASSTSVIDPERQQVEHAESVSDALRYVPGAWTETRGRKVKTFLSLRGQTYPYPEYALDGLWQREFDEQPYQLPASEFERIEVVRSAGALLLGLQGLSGVVNLVPRIGERPGVEALAEGGSDGYARARVGWSWQGERVETRVSGGARRTDGESGAHAAEEQIDGALHVGVELAPELRLRSHLFAYTGSRELAAARNPATPALQRERASYDPQRSLLWFGKLTWQQGGSATLDLGATAAWRSNRYVVTAPRPATTAESDREFSLNAMQAIALADSNHLRFGALYDRVISPTGKRFYAGRALDVDTVSVVVADQQRVGDVVLDAAWRWSREYLRRYGAYNIEGSASGLTTVSTTDTWGPEAHSVALGADWRLDERFAIDGHAAAGLVRPRDGQITAAGDEPDPERRVNLDLGARFDEGAWEASATLFTQGRLDAIVLTGQTVTIAGRTVELYDNRDLLTVGGELSAAHDPRTGPAGRLSASLQEHGQRSAGSWVRDPERPRVILGGQAGWKGALWRADVLVRHLGGYENDRFTVPAAGPAALGDAWVVDLTARWDVTANAALTAALENITDDRSQAVAGYPEAGRRGSIGLLASW